MNHRLKHPETGQETFVGSEAEADYMVEHSGWEKVEAVPSDTDLGLDVGTIRENAPKPAEESTEESAPKRSTAKRSSSKK